MDGGGEATGSGPAEGVPVVAGGGAAGIAGAGGAAGDPGECVSRGAAAGVGVGGVFSDSSHGDASRGVGGAVVDYGFAPPPSGAGKTRLFIKAMTCKGHEYPTS